jgi:hypothetical protein
MRLVFNSTPLIYLAKVGLLPLLKKLPHERLTTAGVKEEVVDRGKEKFAKDALIIESAVQEGTLKIRGIANRGFLRTLSRVPELHPTDAEVLVLAREIRGIAVIDDRVSREAARVYGIEHGGTAFILALLIAHKLIAKEAARAALDDMISLGWRCSVEDYSQMIKMIEEMG